MPKRDDTNGPKKLNRYSAIIGTIFKNHYKSGKNQFEFSRDEFVEIARALNIALPKNLGDTIYSFRFRTVLPDEIVATATKGMEWGIELAGKGQYRFKLGKFVRIVPTPDLIAIKIPDAMPEIITADALTHEQSLLAKVRYNRLIDIFLGIAAYSLQNHLQTFVKDMGQIEVDEVYVGLNRHGQQFVVPVQAKGGTDRLGVTQTRQDIACRRQKFPRLSCRPISAQFMADETIALFETYRRKSGPRLWLRFARVAIRPPNCRSRSYFALRVCGDTESTGRSPARPTSLGPAARWQYSWTAAIGTVATANTYRALTPYFGITRSKRISAAIVAFPEHFAAMGGLLYELRSAPSTNRPHSRASPQSCRGGLIVTGANRLLPKSAYQQSVAVGAVDPDYIDGNFAAG